jgi:hypothetical protein
MSSWLDIIKVSLLGIFAGLATGFIARKIGIDDYGAGVLSGIVLSFVITRLWYSEYL